MPTVPEAQYAVFADQGRVSDAWASPTFRTCRGLQEPLWSNPAIYRRAPATRRNGAFCGPGAPASISIAVIRGLFHLVCLFSKVRVRLTCIRAGCCQTSSAGVVTRFILATHTPNRAKPKRPSERMRCNSLKAVFEVTLSSNKKGPGARQGRSGIISG